MELISHGNNGISGGANNSGGGGGGGGGPAPFLVKTYEMVDDSSTDEIVSWSSNQNSFVVWDPPEFSRRLLPTYFKHNNFSSFIRQLNTYGFRKIDPERWEFANEEFIKDQKHLLKNIHRRKPIHSHTNPQGSDDPERAALEEEIEKLSREKNAVQTNLKRIVQQKDMTRNQLDALERKVEDMEQRQRNMMTYLEIATKNPTFVEHLVRMGSESMSFSAINKKRRQDVPAISYVDDHGSNSFPSHGFQQDFSKLRLELSPTVSDTTFLSPTEQSSNEDGMSQQTRTSNDDLNVASMRTEALMLAHETLELTDTCASLCPRQAAEIDCNSTEDEDCLLLCQLSLTLASSSQHSDDNQYSAKLPQSNNDNINNNDDVMSGVASKEGNHRDIRSNGNATDDPHEAPTSNQGQTSAQGPNDVFWERFLTERPVDTEETSSSFRGNQYEEEEDRKPEQENSWRSRNDNEKLSL